MKRLTSILLTGILPMLFTVVLLTPGGVRAAGLSCGAWSVVKSPDAGTSYNFLNAVAAVTANNVWAVGDYHKQDITGPPLTLTEQWNGTSWSVVPSPNVSGAIANVLLGVAAVTANDIWAVGWYESSSKGTLIEHWNGTKWSVVSSPNPDPLSSTFADVAVVSATNVWAVGGGNGTLTEQWNGKKWSVVKSANVGSGDDTLIGVAATTAGNIWAVGWYRNTKHFLRTLIEQWNGSSWTVVPSPNIGSSHNFLVSVAVISATDAWAVGGYTTNNNSLSATLTERWNGTNWQVVSSPNVGTSDNTLSGVAAASASNVWTVGDYFDISSRNYLTLTEFFC